MHPSSMATVSRFSQTYLSKGSELKIIDIGSLDINGSYKHIFDNDLWEYIGIDIKEGPNVDLILRNPYLLPFDDNSIDIIISGQAFEHMEYPWLMMGQVSRVLKVEGYCCIVVPSAGAAHESPDCWRILPDGMKAMADLCGLTIVELGSSGGTWNDTYLIAKKDN
jgi:SAM-dependent methyltransferase